MWVRLPPLPLIDCPGGEKESCHSPKVAVQVRLLAGVLGKYALVVKRTSLHASNVAFRVQILAEALLEMVLWPRGKGTSVTRRGAVVRLHPGSLSVVMQFVA